MIKSEHQVIIEQPIETVMELFKNQDYFAAWQKSLISFKNTTPTVGEKGSKRSMKIRVAGTTITMIEEITAIDLPHLWEATYRTNGVINKQSNRFKEIELTENGISQKATLWESTATFTFTGMMRLIARGRPQLFTAQTHQHMEDFKTFAASK
ncbi:MAG: SRPBCC family protein [Nonlabens sp.]|uniref:SRPBCC family protein n=1 Tax=Nonlabens sp. TaxID=1888209 RepID=UPI003EF406D2